MYLYYSKIFTINYKLGSNEELWIYITLITPLQTHPHTHVLTYTILMAILPCEPGLADKQIDFPSPFIPTAWDRPKFFITSAQTHKVLHSI